MDLTHAIEMHDAWKMKLKNAITAQETVDADSLAKDNTCEFGKWLHGEGESAYGKLPSFSTCVAKHAAFHVEAGKVARDINAKKYKEAEDQIDFSSTPYGKAASEVKAAVLHLKQESGT